MKLQKEVRFGLIIVSAFLTGLLLASPAWATTVLTFPQVVERDGPIYWARLAEGSGTVLVDSSGSGVSGSYLGTAAPGATGFIAESADGKAATFSGSADADDNAVFDFTTAFSVLVLAKNTSDDLAVAQTLASKYDNTAAAEREWLMLIGDDEKMNVTISGDGTLPRTNFSVDAFSTDVFHFWAFTYDSGTVKMYVDGVDKDVFEVETLPASMFNGSSPMQIGRLGDGSFWDGIIDEVLIYDKVLTPSQIADHYDSLFNPEPATMAIFGLGALGIFFKRRFRGKGVSPGQPSQLSER